MKLSKEFSNDLLNDLLEAGDAWQASDNLLEILFDKKRREDLFMKFLAVNNDVSFDWFYKYYMEELAERAKKKQDFTPPAIAKMMSQLIGESGSNALDVAAGTGQLVITRWNYDRQQHPLFSYRPSDYWYQAEELKEEGKPARSLPFLLFNFLIRGMNGVVIAGDSLTRRASQVYFITNPRDNPLGFSDLNVMPRSIEVEQMFDVRSWVDDPIDHIETNLEDYRYSEDQDQQFIKKLKSVHDFIKGAS